MVPLDLRAHTRRSVKCTDARQGAREWGVRERECVCVRERRKVRVDRDRVREEHRRKASTARKAVSARKMTRFSKRKNGKLSSNAETEQENQGR